MPLPKMTLARLFVELRGSFPAPGYIPEDNVELTFSHEDARELHRRIEELLDKEQRLQIALMVLERANPHLFNSLINNKVL